VIQTVAVEFERVSDLLEAYFQEVRRYNRSLGAYEMTAEELRDAREREAVNYRRVEAARARLREAGITV
jgi:hypothetical protein